MQLLSIDVVIGALSMGLFAVKLFQVSPGFLWWVVLALSVWVIYTVDHLIDSFSMKNEAIIVRHQLHYQYRYLFIVLISILIATILFIVWFFLDRRIFVGGIALGFGALIYFGMITLGREKKLCFQKEFFISLFYIAGIWFTPVLLSGKEISPFNYSIIALFIVLVWTEGIIIAVYEYSKDIKDNHISFVTFFGRKRSNYFLIFQFVLISVLLIATYSFADTRLQVLAFTISFFMVVGLLALFIFQKIFAHHELYKTLGELIFWLPGILWIIT